MSQLQDGTPAVLVCEDEPEPLHKIAPRTICCFISVFFLTLTIIVYILVKELRDLQVNCIFFLVMKNGKLFVFRVNVLYNQLLVWRRHFWVWEYYNIICLVFGVILRHFLCILVFCMHSSGSMFCRSTSGELLCEFNTKKN